MILTGRLFLLGWIILGLILPPPVLAKHKKHTHAYAKKITRPSGPIHGAHTLTAELNSILNSVDSQAVVGVQIKTMKSRELLFSKNENHLFVPASILKILTGEAGLLFLGPEYKFQTKLLSDAQAPIDGTLYGNLYLVHSGDPTLNYSDLEDLMELLKTQGIQRVTGNVYIDNHAYDQVNYGPGWQWSDQKYCYAAPINASIINHNCLSFQIAPASKPGNLANIIPSPKYYYSGFRNSVVTKAHGSNSCYVHLDTNGDSTITVEGCLAKGHHTQGISTVITNPVEYNKYLMRDLFKRADIQVDGVFAAGTAPNNLSVIATHDSKPLSMLVTEMMKMSDNIIAGSLFKKIGSIYFKQPGSWQNGSLAVTHILSKDIGVNTSGINIIDGSGLSRFNQISPAQMMQVLDFAFHNPETNYNFVASLPIAGVDGTLKKRLQNIAWKIRAKTGTMSGVVALAGYAMSHDKEPIAFVIIINSHASQGWYYKEIEDRIVTALTKYTRVS